MEEAKSHLPALPDTLDYPTGLAIEVAVLELVAMTDEFDMDEEIRNQLKQFDLTEEAYEKIKNNPNFRADVVAHKVSLKSDGGTIKRKAEVLFDHYLSTYVPVAFNDESVAPKDKFQLLELLGKVSGRLNQKSDVVQAVEAASKASQPSIVINMPQGFDAAKLTQTAERVDNK